MKFQNLDQEDTWSVSSYLPAGTHDVTIEELEEGTSSGGHNQWQLDVGNDAGSLRDWIVITATTMGKVKQLLEAAGIEVQGGEWDFDPQTLVGKKVRIRAAEEPKYNDPTSRIVKIQAYMPAIGDPATTDTEGLGGAASSEERLPF